MHIRSLGLPVVSFLAVVVFLSHLPFMGDRYRDLLADIEPEESFLNSLDKAETSSPSSTSSRRVSASGTATRLKDRNLIPPLNTPTGRRTSLPRASKTVLVQSASAQRAMPVDKTQPNAAKASPEPGAAFLDRMENMFKNLREDIAKSESNTGQKIDDLTAKLTSRLSKAEADLSKVGMEVATTRTELLAVREKMDEQERSLPEMVEIAVARKLDSRPADAEPSTGRRPRQLGSARIDQTEKEEKYWDARASLRMWPVVGDDMAAAVIDFLDKKLLCPPGMVNVTDVVGIVRVVPRPDAFARDQVIVRFSSVRLRDEVKALSKNLDGTDKFTGVQIEPPDFLRTHYQTFQRLAIQMKKKHPSLKRSVRFLDSELCLTMNVLTARGAEWRTIDFEDAKATMKKTRERTGSISRRELEEMVDVDGSRKKRRRTVASSDSSDMEDDNDVTIVENNSADNNNKSKSSRRSISFINANARSLRPKLESLYDCFLEKSLDLAIISETWFQDGAELQSATELLKHNYALGLITRNRDSSAANGRLYGGVAVVYRLKTTSMKEFPLVNPAGFEVLATVGKISGIKGKVFCLACYAPPNISPARAKLMMEFVSDVTSEAKRKFPECTIIIAGDFNQWEAEYITEEHPDIREVVHGPTRNGLSIDRSFVNFERSITEARTLPPLETEDNRASDHKIAFARATFDKPESKSITYTYRHYTERGATDFLAELESTDWLPTLEAPTTEEKVARMQVVLDTLMSKHFKLKTTTRRISDPPWFNNRLRWLIKKRRKIYDREGRSPRYKTMRKKSDKLAKDRASVFLQQQRKLMTSSDACRHFYRNVRAFSTREKPPDFDVRDLYPGQPDGAVAESLAVHFNAISSEFAGLQEGDVPDAIDLDLPMLDQEQVAKRLRDIKKPKSMVLGDVFPALINRSSHLLAIPLTSIFNSITATASWPLSWKTEYVTPIPKKPHPETPDDLRNISCTQLVSKAYESFVLEWLNSQVKVRTNQFGGMKGSGTEHYLIELWQKTLENLEDPRAGVLLTSIDYSKAFNRLDFAACLRALKEKGACRQLINIIASFLSGRTMRVKIGSSLSDAREILGGVPQGSRLGVLLFNILIDSFEAHSNDVIDYNPPGHVPPNIQPAPNPPPLAVVHPEPQGRDYRHLPPWKVELLQVLKYVDDNMVQEKINFDTVPTDGHSFRIKHAVRTQNLTHGIVHEALDRGLRVNNAKTTALCIAEVKDYIPKAFIYDMEGNQVKSGNEMKILGFHFSSDVGMAAQVNSIKRNFYAKKWVLTHLASKGFSQLDLVQVYRATILPIHDYCSCVYNSSLTQTQADALERLQAHALKTIFGYHHSYSSLLETTGLKTLQARRDARCDKFAAKCLENPRYRDWFPLNLIARPTRNALRYKESFARTKRLYNSPLYHMRRRLNGRQL